MKKTPAVLKSQGIAGLLLIVVCLACGAFTVSSFRDWPPTSEHWSVYGFCQHALWKTGMSAKPPEDYLIDLIERTVEPLIFGELDDEEFDEHSGSP